MSRVFHPFLDRFIVTYIAYILVYAWNDEKHEEHLRLELQTLKEQQLYVKFSKCECWLDRVDFLKHFIFTNDMYVDHQNMEVVDYSDWTVEFHGFSKVFP